MRPPGAGETREDAFRVPNSADTAGTSRTDYSPSNIITGFGIGRAVGRSYLESRGRVRLAAARAEHETSQLVVGTVAPAAATRVDPHTSERGPGSDPRQAENGSREATLLPVPRPPPSVELIT
jgi:hypothetical protein